MRKTWEKIRPDIIALSIVGACTFLALALLSYNPSDPSFNTVYLKTHKIQNLCGVTGSYVADLLYQALGFSVWLLFVPALHVLIGIRQATASSATVKFINFFAVSVCLAALIGILFPEAKFGESNIALSGFLGALLAQGLLSVLNFAGAVLVLVIGLLMMSVVYWQLSLSEMKVIVAQAAQDLAHGITGKLPRFPIMRQLKATAVTTIELQKPTNIITTENSRFQLAAEADEAIEEKTNHNSEEAKISELTPPTRRFDIANLLSVVRKEEKSEKPKITTVPQRTVETWSLPNLKVLKDPPIEKTKVNEREISKKAEILTNKLAQFGARGKITNIRPGPAVTLFEFKPDADVKISKITELADDLSLALSSESVRIIAPIPGRDVVGIETSNSDRDTVHFKNIVGDEIYWREQIKIPLVLGQTVDGQPLVVDLRKMPHLMVAGSTGSGKSVFVVSALCGMLFRHSPKTLRLILIDPKQVDLAVFSKVPHLLLPPVREPHKAVTSLKWAIREMDKRYRSMAEFGANGLEKFNEAASELSKEEKIRHETFNEEIKQTGEPGKDYYFTPQPYIVVVVEEFGDLMAVDKNNVEQAVVRLSQMARACGIHLILAMQSPRKDVVTGLIKTNIPGRISFKVASKTDSRIILDESGAERLLAQGDMLFLSPGVAKPQRVHGPWIDESDINNLTTFWSAQGEPEYNLPAMEALEKAQNSGDSDEEASGFADEDEIEDDKYTEILDYVASLREVSASLLQRRFRLGYPRAARLIEVFEVKGIVGPSNGSKPRQVLLSK